MRRIYKYAVRPTEAQSIDLPVGAQLLTVQVQNGSPQLWALVDPEAAVQPRTLRVYGTGHAVLRDVGEYVGTFQLYEGALVLHLFAEAAQ